MKLKDDNSVRLKIMLLIPNLGRGGAQQVFRQQFRSLSTKYDVTGCVFNWEGSFEEDRMEKIVSLDVPAGRTIPGKIRNFLLRVRRLKRIKKALGVDVTISHLEGADYINLLSRVGDKVICWIHGTKRYDENIEGKLGLIRRRLMIPIFYRGANKIVTVGKGIKEELGGDYPKLESKLITIYNGFDIKNIIDKGSESIEGELTSLFLNHKILITHCRLSRQKNLKSLLQIFKSLPKSEQIKLIIVGDGELREDLLVFCNAIDLKYWSIWDSNPIHYNADLYFIGQQSNPFKYLSKASLYIMTSGWEGFPLALCEALACGLPVITSDCFTGPREIIAPDIDLPQPVEDPQYTQYGVLMPLINPGNSLALTIWVNEVKKILTSQDSVLSKEDRINRIKEFDFSKTKDQTVTLIQKIVS